MTGFDIEICRKCKARFNCVRPAHTGFSISPFKQFENYGATEINYITLGSGNLKEKVRANMMKRNCIAVVAYEGEARGWEHTLKFDFINQFNWEVADVRTRSSDM